MTTYVAVAPRLPNPPKEYTQAAFEQFNNALRLYFNQLDENVRVAGTSPESQAQVWFLG